MIIPLTFYPFHSIIFLCQEWHNIAGLHNLLRVDNKSLQALRLPVAASQGKSLRLPALPSSLRVLQINANIRGLSPLDKRNCIEELLELALSCCPQLTMLLLPLYTAISNKALAKLAQFEKQVLAIYID